MKSVFYALICLVVLAGCSSAVSSPDGLWFGVVKPEDGLVDAVSLTLQDGEFVAAGGTVSIVDDQIRVDFPTGAVFMGGLPQAGSSLEGFYVQPGNQIGGQRMAHFLALMPSGDNSWSATPNPIRRQFSLFMDIQGSAGEAGVATLLNHQSNFTGPARRYDLKHAENTYELIPGNGNDAFASFEYADGQDNISIGFGPIETFTFERVAKGDAIAKQFYGDNLRGEIAMPSASQYWNTDAPASVGFDESKLTALVQDLAAESALNERRNLVHSLLVARNGKLVVEEYFRGYDQDTPHDTRSAAKTYASVLVGALRQDGYDLTVDTPVSDYIPMAGNPESRPVSLGDLLTHRSGLACDDADDNSTGNENNMWNQSEYEDLWALIAGLPQNVAPGTRYAYCSGGINLVGAVLSGASGQSVLSLIQKHLFEPLGFRNAYWNTMPNNEAYLGGGAHIRARDFLKLGQLYLDNGRWNGKQLIDPEWIEQSLTPLIEITAETTGLSEERFGNFYFGGTDGLAWHIFTVTVDGRDYQTYEASGNGGQIMIIVPELDLAVSLMGGNYGQGYVWGKWRQNIVAERIITAIETF